MYYRAIAPGIAWQPIREKNVWRRQLTALVPLLALYLALAFFQIDNQSLWTDEIISLSFAVSGEPISSIWFKSQCPLYYVLLRLWTKAFGSTDFALRSLSAIMGAAAVCVTYAVGLKLFNRRTAAVAALLLTTSPFFIWYAQEVRYINLMLLTSLLATYFFHRAISRGRLVSWVSYSVASIIATFSFVSAIFLFVVHGLYLLRLTQGHAVRLKWIICQFVIFALFSSWFVVQYGSKLGPALTKGTSQVSVQRAPKQQPHPIVELGGAISYTFFAFSTGFSLGPSLRELHIARSMSTLSQDAAVVIPVGIFFATLFVLGIRQLGRPEGASLFVLLWLGIPILLVLLIAATTSFGRYNVRYVAIALPAYILILAGAIQAFRRLGIQISLLAAVVCVNGISLSNYYFEPRYSREDARGAARYLEAVESEGGLILVLGQPRALRYYYEGELPVETINARGRNFDVAGRLRELLDRYKRVWFVEIRSSQRDPNGKVKATLDSLADLQHHKRFSGVDLYLYDMLSQ